MSLLLQLYGLQNLVKTSTLYHFKTAHDLISLLHHPTNTGIKAIAKPKVPVSQTHFYQGDHLQTKLLQACCAHPPESSFDH